MIDRMRKKERRKKMKIQDFCVFVFDFELIRFFLYFLFGCDIWLIKKLKKMSLSFITTIHISIERELWCVLEVLDNLEIWWEKKNIFPENNLLTSFYLMHSFELANAISTHTHAHTLISPYTQQTWIAWSKFSLRVNSSFLTVKIDL